MSKTPRHVAIIMDGNGRWARSRSLPRLRGHEEGAQSVRAVVRACRKAGVKYLTLYAFSTENWSRPKSEISGLMRLLVRFLKAEEEELHKHQIRLRVMGRIADLPPAVRRELKRVIGATEGYSKAHLIFALSYGARDEIVDAARRIARRVRDDGLDPAGINERVVSSNLYLPDVPDPDLLIRTSGELRLSNFMLWQLSYAEFYFTDVLWPDFREDEFDAALGEYASRKRRFGDI